MNIETLKKFCHPYAEKFEQPFVNAGKTYATDGFTLLCVEGELTDKTLEDGPFPSDSVKLQFSGPFGDAFPLSDFSTEEEIEPCRSCGGQGYISKCPECGGSGEIELDSGWNYYSCQCQSCDGEGYLPDKESAEVCDDCEGSGMESVMTRVRIGDFDFDNRKINKLIENLPKNTTISPPPKVEYGSSTSKAALILWNGGKGLLMPLR